MNNHKIRIEADLSDVYKDLDKLATKADQLFKNIGRQDLGGQASALRSLLDQVGKAADKIQDMGGKGISTQGLDGISKKFHEIGTAAQKVEKRVSGKSDWSSWISTFSDELKQASKAEKDLTHLQDILSRHRIRSTRDEAKEYAKAWESIRTKFAGTRFAKSSLEDVVESRRSKARSEILQELGLERKRHIENLRKVAMPGSAFSVVRNAAEGASRAETGAFSLGGIARFAGWATAGVVGYGAIQGLRGAFGKFGTAQDEAIGYTDLRKSIGLMAADFDVLRASVRAASDGFGLAYNESQRLAEQFVRSSGVISGASSVAEGVRISAGFGRGYGINPALATQFFGAASRFGGQDNRRLALMIGEAVGKSNLSSKLPEVLGSLSSYLNTAATSGLSTPNTSAYLDLLSAFSTSGITGLMGNPTGTAAIMSQVDASIRRGGAAGEASKNFNLGLYSHISPGFNAFDLGLVSAQGAFGTFRGAFGKDSAAYKMAQARGDAGLMREYAGMAGIGGTILGHQMRGLIAEYGGNTRGLMKSVAGHFGVSDPQASALITAYTGSGGFGGLEKRLQAAGIDTQGMNPQRIARLAELVYNEDAARRQRNKLLRMPGLSEPDRSSLLTGTAEDQKNALLSLTNRLDLKDPGDQARQAQINMDREMQKLVTGLLPAVNTMKEGIIELVRFFNGLFGRKSEFLEHLDSQKRTIDFQSQINPGPAEQVAKMRGMVEYLDQDRDLKLTRAQAAGIVGNLSHETGRFKNLQEINPKKGLGGFGYAQWTGPRRKAFLAWAKQHKLNPTTTAANLGFLKHELLTNEKRALLALRATDSVSEAARVFMEQYERPGINNLPAREREALIALGGDTIPRKIPPEMRRQPGQQPPQRVAIDGKFTLHNQDNEEIAPPILINHNPAPGASWD